MILLSNFCLYEIFDQLRLTYYLKEKIFSVFYCLKSVNLLFKGHFTQIQLGFALDQLITVQEKESSHGFPKRLLFFVQLE